MSTDQRNNGNATPPSTPSGNKDKNPETEEREEEVTEEEKKQQRLDALMRILDVEEKKTNEKLERIRRERERTGGLSQDIKAHCLNDDGEAELADLLRGFEEDVYQALPEKDGGKKRRWAERKREKKGKGKQLGRPEKRRKTEKVLPETVDPEVRCLDEVDAWVDGETIRRPVPLASGEQPQEGVPLLPAPQGEVHKPPGERESSADGLSSRSGEEETEEGMEETKRVRSWVKKVDASEKEENPRSEDGHGSVDGDGDVEMEDPSTETTEGPSMETTEGPSTFGPFVATSDGTVFHVNLESTTVVVKTEEEESGIPHDNEEDLARWGRLQKKNKLNAKAKAKEAEKTAEKKPETEEHEAQVPVAQRPAPCVVEAPGVFFETATSTGKLIPVQVEMIEVLDSDDEAPAP
ncbi:hypothetical protein C8R45DRAFT_1087570 [Mycena sanguinolenta]|nr:hypothetical protein C8R45DRAFT_1087570 [Mycena sanguinolenta]